jgi:hypothetical protein
MQKLDKLIQELEANIANFETVNLAVSKASIGWHIDHCLIILSRVISALEKSNPDDYKPKFNWKRVLVFATNTVSRGKIKAPSVALPEGEITEALLKQHLEKVKAKILKIETFHKNSFFPHPFLNDLNVKQTQKFLVLHTTHHLKIIRDILKK